MSGPTREADFADLADDPAPAHMARGPRPGDAPVSPSARFGSLDTASVEIGQVRMVHGAPAMLALSVLADSGIEHSRGQYHNPAMFTPLVSAKPPFRRVSLCGIGTYSKPDFHPRPARANHGRHTLRNSP